MKLELDFNGSKDEATHYVCDEGVGYWVKAPRRTLDGVANAFLRGYDGSGKISFWVQDIKKDITQDYTGYPNRKAVRA